MKVKGRAIHYRNRHRYLISLYQLWAHSTQLVFILHAPPPVVALVQKLAHNSPQAMLFTHVELHQLLIRIDRGIRLPCCARQDDRLGWLAIPAGAARFLREVRHVDSNIAFPSNLAVARRGIRWSPTRMAVSDLQSDLYLRPVPVTYFNSGGVQHQVHRPIHHVPHYTFGRVIGLEDVSLFLLFPRLNRAEQACSKLRDEEFQLWMDGILLPAIYQTYGSAHVQQYPSGYEHSQYNSTARDVETLARHVHPVAREQ